MKSPMLLLAVSLAANVALLALVFLRPAPVDSAMRPATPAVTHSPAAADAKKTEALLAALVKGDSAALAAAGVAPEVINQLAAARAFGRLAKISRDLDGPRDDNTTPYWRGHRRDPRPQPTKEQRAERFQAEREFQDAMQRAFGDVSDIGLGDGRYRFLSPEKREALQRIERDYDELRNEVDGDSAGLDLAPDREKRRLLDAEKKRDLAAALSPAEREQMELRTSRSADAIINAYGDIIASEDEYKQLYEIRKKFDDVYSTDDYFSRPHTPAEDRARVAAERAVNDELRAEIGDDRWAATSRANDNEFQTLTALATRLNLPAGTPDQVYALRDTYAAQSLALQHDASLSDSDRRVQLKDLATRVQADLATKLGTDAAEAYARSAGWLNALKNGNAFTTDPRQLPAGSPRPGPGATAFPLPPPRSPAPPPKT